MSYEFNNELPIYLQIIELLKKDIISKKYLPGKKIPSVRELALDFGVNPNTVQKALAELEDIGLIFTERTNGKFVTTNHNMISQLTEQTINKMISDFMCSLNEMGLNKKQILEIINKELKWKFLKLKT